MIMRERWPVLVFALVMAAIPLLASIWGYMQPRLRQVEDEIPDALEPEEPAPGAHPGAAAVGAGVA